MDWEGPLILTIPSVLVTTQLVQKSKTGNAVVSGILLALLVNDPMPRATKHSASAKALSRTYATRVARLTTISFRSTARNIRVPVWKSFVIFGALASLRKALLGSEDMASRSTM